MNDKPKKQPEKNAEETEVPGKPEPSEAVIPPVPPAMSEERRKELEAILKEQFKDGEDVDDDEDDDMSLYRPR